MASSTSSGTWSLRMVRSYLKCATELSQYITYTVWNNIHDPNPSRYLEIIPVVGIVSVVQTTTNGIIDKCPDLVSKVSWFHSLTAYTLASLSRKLFLQHYTLSLVPSMYACMPSFLYMTYLHISASQIDSQGVIFHIT